MLSVESQITINSDDWFADYISAKGNFASINAHHCLAWLYDVIVYRLYSWTIQNTKRGSMLTRVDAKHNSLLVGFTVVASHDQAKPSWTKRHGLYLPSCFSGKAYLQFWCSLIQQENFGSVGRQDSLLVWRQGGGTREADYRRGRQNTEQHHRAGGMQINAVHLKHIRSSLMFDGRKILHWYRATAKIQVLIKKTIFRAFL